MVIPIGEGLTSLLDEDATINFIAKERGQWTLEEKPQHLVMLENFTHHFVKYEQVGDSLTATDLRLGMVDYLPFQFVFATLDGDGSWSSALPIQLESPPNVRPKHLPALCCACWETRILMPTCAMPKSVLSQASQMFNPER